MYFLKAARGLFVSLSYKFKEDCIKKYFYVMMLLFKTGKWESNKRQKIPLTVDLAFLPVLLFSKINSFASSKSLLSTFFKSWFRMNPVFFPSNMSLFTYGLKLKLKYVNLLLLSKILEWRFFLKKKCYVYCTYWFYFICVFNIIPCD